MRFAHFLRARNDLTMRIFQRSKKAYRSWRALSDEISPIIDGLVPEKLAEAVGRSAELRGYLEEQPVLPDHVAVRVGRRMPNDHRNEVLRLQGGAEQ